MKQLAILFVLAVMLVLVPAANACDYNRAAVVLAVNDYYTPAAVVVEQVRVQPVLAVQKVVAVQQVQKVVVQQVKVKQVVQQVNVVEKVKVRQVNQRVNVRVNVRSR